MALRLAFRNSVGRVARRGGATTALRTRGGGHDSPPLPPFARTQQPSGPLPEEYELVWDDSVSAETCLDFDAQNYSRAEGVKWWLGGLLFFFSVFQLASMMVPEEPAVSEGAPGARGDAERSEKCGMLTCFVACACVWTGQQDGDSASRQPEAGPGARSGRGGRRGA